MTNDIRQVNEVRKPPYEKPKIVGIELLADEVLAVGCKTQSGGGRFTPAVHCATQNCFNQGS